MRVEILPSDRRRAAGPEGTPVTGTGPVGVHVSLGDDSEVSRAGCFLLCW